MTNYVIHEGVDKPTDRSDALTACDHYIGILSHHCGPYARHAGNILKRQGQELTEFTKDGISIVTGLEEEDRQKEIIRQLSRYVGLRVNDVCKDGTTTSMIQFLRFLKSTTTVWQQYAHAVTPGLFAEIVNEILSRTEERLSEDRVTIDRLVQDFRITREEAVRFIAYNQAMISSKGDTVMSKAIVEAIVSTPPEIWELYRLTKSGVESDDHVLAERQEADMVIDAVILDKNHFNTTFDTQYEGRGVDLYITANDLVDGSPEVPSVIQLFAGLDLENDLVIASTNHGRGLITAAANHRFGTQSRGQVILVTISKSPSDMHQYQAVVAQCLAGKPDPLSKLGTSDFADAVIRSVDVDVKFNKIYLTGLYERDEDNIFHPYYLDPEKNPRYTKLRYDLMNGIEQFRAAILQDATTERRASDLIQYYRQLVSTKIIDLKICGSLHDHMAAYSVAEDAYGSAISSLRKGFIAGGHHRMLDCLTKIAVNRDTYNRTMSESIQAALVDSYIADLRDILRCIYYPPGVPAKDAVVDLGFLNITERDTYEYAELGFDDKNGWGDLQSTVIDPRRDDGKVQLIQPYVGFTELIKRMKELLSKYATTSLTIDSTR